MIFVHQDLVGASVPLQILRRYLRENQLLGQTALQPTKERDQLKIFFKRMTFKQIKSLSPVSRGVLAWVCARGLASAGCFKKPRESLNGERALLSNALGRTGSQLWPLRVLFDALSPPPPPRPRPRTLSLAQVPNPLWLTLFRDPHQRALSLYRHVASKMLPHLQRSGQLGRAGLRTDDDTTSGHHASLLAAYVRQDPATLARWPQLRYVAQWTSWAESPGAAEAELRKHAVLVGLTDHMDEFLVMARHRLGWPDSRGVLYADLRPEAHERGGSLAHSHVAYKVDPSLRMALDLQPAMRSELAFYAAVRTIFLEQVRGFGMARLEREVSALKATLASLHAACASADPTPAATVERRPDGWGGFGAFGGFGTFGAGARRPSGGITAATTRAGGFGLAALGFGRRRLFESSAGGGPSEAAEAPALRKGSEAGGGRREARRLVRSLGEVAGAGNGTASGGSVGAAPARAAPVAAQPYRRLRGGRTGGQSLPDGREPDNRSSARRSLLQAGDESFLLSFLSDAFSADNSKQLKAAQAGLPQYREGWGGVGGASAAKGRWGEPGMEEDHAPAEAPSEAGPGASAWVGAGGKKGAPVFDSWGRPAAGPHSAAAEGFLVGDGGGGRGGGRVGAGGGAQHLGDGRVVRPDSRRGRLQRPGEALAASLAADRQHVPASWLAAPDERRHALPAPNPKAFETCSLTRSGLVTRCKEAAAGDRLEFTVQCMVHRYDRCTRRDAGGAECAG